MINKKFFFYILVAFYMSCTKNDECTKTQTLYGGYGPYGDIPDQTIEVPCDYPDPEPIRDLF